MCRYHTKAIIGNTVHNYVQYSNSTYNTGTTSTASTRTGIVPLVYVEESLPVLQHDTSTRYRIRNGTVTYVQYDVLYLGLALLGLG